MPQRAPDWYMKRRAVLTGAGFALGVPTGLVWSEWHDWRGSCPEPVRNVETTYTLGTVLTDAAREGRGDLDSPDSIHYVIANEATLSETVLEESDAWSFAAGTDFDREFLVLVQVTGSSTPRLVLECLRWTDDGLDVDVSLTTQSRIRTGDLAVHTLFLKIGAPRGEVPESVSLDVEGQNPESFVDRLV